MIRRSSLIALEVMMGLVTASLMGLGVAWWRLSQGPLELNLMRQAVETELSRTRADRPVVVDRVQLTWSTSGGALELHAVGVTFEDTAHHPLSRFSDVRIELDVLALATGHIALDRADFSGGEVTFTHRRDGALWVAFGPPGSTPDIVAPPAREDEPLMVRVSHWLDGLQAAFRPVGAGGHLSDVSIHGAKFTVIDEASGGTWVANESAFALHRNHDTLVLQADARLEGAQGLAPANLRITTSTSFQSAIIEFGARNVRPRALFSDAALGPFAGLDAPFTANIKVGLDRHSGVNAIEGEATLGRGTAHMGDGTFDVTGGRLHGRYDLASDELVIDQLNLLGARTRINGDIHVHQASAILRAQPGHPAPFDMALPSATLDAPGVFADQIQLASLQADGEIDSNTHEFRFAHLHAKADDATVDASGKLYWAAAPDHRVRMGVVLDGAVAGNVNATTVLKFWPIGLGEGARAYLATSITGGQVSNGRVHLDIRPSDVASDIWRQESVDVRFDLAAASMRFITTMSPVTDANATAVLGGNSFNLQISQARLNDLNVTHGVVDIPHLKPHGQALNISAHVEGDARHVMEVLMEKPLDLQRQLPVDAASVTGHASVDLRLMRPMQNDVQFAQYRFNVDGHFSDFAGNMNTKHVALSQGSLDVHGDQNVIHVTGPVRAGTSEVRIAWNEYLQRHDRSSSEYQIAGDFDADDLVRLGYPLASYAQGRIGVTVNGQGRGFDVDQANVELDLRNAFVESPWRFWTKATGTPASVRFTIAREATGGVLAFNNLDARGAGLVAQGRVRAAVSDGRIVEADLPRLAIEGRSDAHVYATRASDGALEVRVQGALFDGAPFMDGDNPPAAVRTGAVNVAHITAAHPPNNEPLVRASVMVDHLKLRGGATLANAHVNVVVAHNALALVQANGQSPGNKNFNLALGVRPDDPAGGIRLRADDAGFAMRALVGADNVVGGSAMADGDWRVGPPSQSHFVLHLRDFQVVKLPAMARLLSSAGSLTGLVEMLNGDGIGFSALDAPMIYTDGHLAINDARLAGPSIGLTASGAYNIDADNIHVDGVVVPSYGLNSMLGAVPVLGNLFVSRHGEGVVGMTYSVNGHVAEPRVGVNPLSALTPGILRRIFEPSSRSAPRAQTAAPAVPAAPPHSEAETNTRNASAAQTAAATAQAQPAP